MLLLAMQAGHEVVRDSARGPGQDNHRPARIASQSDAGGDRKKRKRSEARASVLTPSLPALSGQSPNPSGCLKRLQILRRFCILFIPRAGKEEVSQWLALARRLRRAG
jgi:hypothetical protein